MPTPRLRLVFAGTPEFAAHHLQALVDSDRHDIVAVYSQPDRPAGRGKKAQFSAVKHTALAAGLPVLQPQNFKQESDRQALAALQADLMVVVAYGLILPQAVLDIPRLGCINVHASLLPRWRGAAPIQRAIEAGDRQTGVTIMRMEAGLDTGEMLLKACCTIAPEDTAASLQQRLAALGGPALVESIDALANGTAGGEAQDDSQSCYAAKLSKAEAEIDWQQEATQLARKIRAFNPAPCCYTQLGSERLKLWQARALAGEELEQIDTDARSPGHILRANRDGIVVACGHGALCLQSLQLPGGRAMSAGELLNARAKLFTPGTPLGAGHG